MWRSWTSRKRAASTILALLLIGGACADDEYTLRQPISMGPWTFQAERAREQIVSQGGEQWKYIFVSLRLDNYTERHEDTFDDFMNGRTRSSVMSHPRLELIDEDGNRFSGSIRPTSGGSMRSERWDARFLLAPSSVRNMQDSSERASQHRHKHPGDFRLIIENPDHRGGQPRKASIQLE